jgi:hypothetical protein
MMLHKKIRPAPSICCAALLILIFSFVTVTLGKPPIPTSPQEQIKIAGHLDLPGIHVRHMFLQQRGEKSYLFLRRADKNDFAIVDVTDPSKPVLIDRSALREPAGGHVDMPPSGSALALAFVPERTSGTADSGAPASAAGLPTESVRMIDLSDPKHPKTVKTFKGVTSVATDDGRKLVFLTNSEGLWIVSHHLNRPLPLCTSESDLTIMPECD